MYVTRPCVKHRTAMSIDVSRLAPEPSPPTMRGRDDVGAGLHLPRAVRHEAGAAKVGHMKPSWILTVLIFAGLVGGVVVGQLLHDPNFSLTMTDDQHAHATAVGALYFVGNTVFMGLLRMVVLPLIATSVIVGVTSVGDFRELGKIGSVTLLYYVGTMLIAATLGLVLVTTIRPGDAISSEQRQVAQQSYETNEGIRESIERGPQGVIGAMQRLVSEIIPNNVVAAAANGQVLPVIFFSILLGIVLTTMGDAGRPIVDLVTALFEAVMKLVHGIIWLTPVGVFGLLGWTVARIGLGVFAEAIGGYSFTVLLGLAIHGLIILPLICWIFARTNPFRYLYQMRRAMMTALGTDSSSATLPVTMECATELGGVSRKAAGFVLPLGSTINMDGTALYEAVAVIFLAQAYGIPLHGTVLILVVITATFAAIGAAGIPSAGLVTMVIVVDTVNGTLASMPGSPSLPIAAVGLIVGVDRLLDMFRTVVNVWGDAVGAKLIDRIDRKRG